MLNDADLVNNFLDNMTNQYINKMRNANPQAGEILWGGETEINALGQVLSCRIDIYQENALDVEPSQHGDLESDVVVRLVYCNGNHYKFINQMNVVEDVKPDGNCLFYACLGATSQEQTIEEVSELRNAIADHILDDPDLQANIRMLFEVLVHAQDAASFYEMLEAIPMGSLRTQVALFMAPKLPGLMDQEMLLDGLDEDDINVTSLSGIDNSKIYAQQTKLKNPFSNAAAEREIMTDIANPAGPADNDSQGLDW